MTTIERTREIAQRLHSHADEFDGATESLAAIPAAYRTVAGTAEVVKTPEEAAALAGATELAAEYLVAVCPADDEAAGKFRAATGELRWAEAQLKTAAAFPARAPR